jgi:hypothetical protein
MYASVYVKLDKVELLTTYNFVDRLNHGSWRQRLLAKWRVSFVGMATRVALCLGVDAAIILCMSLRAPIAYKRRVLYIDTKVSAVWWFRGAISRRRSCRAVPCDVSLGLVSQSAHQERTHARTHAARTPHARDATHASTLLATLVDAWQRTLTHSNLGSSTLRSARAACATGSCWER